MTLDTFQIATDTAPHSAPKATQSLTELADLIRAHARAIASEEVPAPATPTAAAATINMSPRALQELVSDFVEVLSGLLVETAQVEAARALQASPSPSSRMDRAWAAVWASHIGGTGWSTSCDDTARNNGISGMTVFNMRRAVRTLKAAGVEPSGKWRIDRATAKKLPQA